MSLAEELHDTVAKALDAFAQIPQENWDLKTHPDKWSKKEILGHLIDSAYHNHPRILNAESKESLVFQGYTQDDWVSKNHYQNREVQEVIQTWRFVNIHMAHLIDHIPEAALNRETYDHNFDEMLMRPIEKGSAASIKYLIEDYIFHIQHHMKQILEK